MEGVPATKGTSAYDGLPPHSQPQQQPPQHVNGGGGVEMGDDGGSIGGGFAEEGDRNSSGNRWPKQETLALIKIRSDMDAAFRDSNLKGPLWDDVSRKLSELGFHRSAKKCREKFENVYKYHRRTKDGRTSKSDKTYRFFDQLQALEDNPRQPPPPPPLSAVKPPMTMSNNATSTTHHPLPLPVPVPVTVTVPSVVSFNLTGSEQNNVSPISVAAPAAMAAIAGPVQAAMNHKRTFPFSQQNFSGSTNSDSTSFTSSDEEPPRKKRKWQEFFGKLMKEVIAKQEELQNKFLEALDRRERDRVAREEAWRAQEMAKMNEEHERVVKERSFAAAKDAAVVTFLQKMAGKTPDAVPLIPTIQQPPLPPPPELQPVVVPVPVVQVSAPPPVKPVAPVLTMVNNVEGGGGGGGGENMLSPSPSRWPKAEINALISLRTQLDTKYQENVPKGPLWEDISAAMRKLGYNRNAKRCKEKWENINKYYKKMKEGNKKRSEDSKTCPYFHQLDAIYSEKKLPAIVARPEQQWPPVQSLMAPNSGTATQGFTVKPETQITPVSAWPQQQWLLPPAVQQQQPPPPQSLQHQHSTAAMEDDGSENDDYDDDEDDEDEGEGEGEGEGGGDEIVPVKPSSMAAV